SGIETGPLRSIRQRLSLEVPIQLQPVIRIQNLLRVLRSGSDLGEERIWIKRDGSHQLIQLVPRRDKCLRRSRLQPSKDRYEQREEKQRSSVVPTIQCMTLAPPSPSAIFILVSLTGNLTRVPTTLE